MTDKNCLFVVQNLNLALFDGGKSDSKLLFFLERQNPKEFLDLEQKIQGFWETNIDTLKNIERIYWVIGPLASYTDTRILNTWLKTFTLFVDQIDFKYLSLDLEIPSETEDLQNIVDKILVESQDPKVLQPDIFWSRTKEYKKV